MKDFVPPQSGPLAAFLASALEGCDLDAATAAVRAGQVFVDGQRVRDPASRVEMGVRVRWHPPPIESTEAEVPVLFEDRDLLIVDKPAGMAVNASETSVAEALVERLGPRATLVHRLDRGTTGVLAFAKNARAAAALSKAFANRSVGKRYLAVVEEAASIEATFEGRIAKDRRRPRARAVHPGGKAAETAVRTLGLGDDFTIVEARPRTGRTHQIRVHLAHAGRPILGDTLYGGPAAVRLGGEVRRIARPLLHALELTLPRELGGHRFRASLPPDVAVFFEAAGLDPAPLESP